MRYAQIYLLMIAFISIVGCETTPKVDNPVLGPPPPRLESALKQQKLEHTQMASRSKERKSILEGDFQESDNPFESPVITVASSSDTSTASAVDESVEELKDSTVVAMVNGTPLFVSDIIGVYDFQLKQAEQRMPPEEYQKLRKALVKSHIERQLLIHEMKTTLKKEQLAMLQEHLDKAFDEERIPELQKAVGASSPQELEEKLNQQGRSLYYEKELFMKQQSALQFMAVKAKSKNDFSREEVLARYKSNLDEYAYPAKARWQRIRISYAKHGGKDKAVGVLDEVIHKLQAGENFGTLAEKYSDGPRAEKKGQWGWTGRGSLADSEVEAALFDLPVGQTSQVFETDDSFQIVKVLDRKEAGHTPFADVQAQLEQSMVNDARMKATRETLDQLFKKAIIESMFEYETEDEKVTN